MSTSKEKFATQVTPEILAEVRDLAQAEGRLLQALVEEALSDLIEKRKKTKARAHVLTAYGTSHENYGDLYRNLAK